MPIDQETGVIGDTEKIFAFLAHLTKMSHDIHSHIAENIIDIDEFLSSPTPMSVYKLQPTTRLPIIVEFIMAVFPTASTSVSIQLGPERTIPVANIAAGIFAVDTRMQLEPEDVRQMIITPAGVGHFEIMGRATKRVIDRP